MQGLSPKLPINYDVFHGGYALHTDFQQLSAQNLKHLVLTAPGERMMLPEFGVGLRNFLFLQENEIEEKIISRIYQQVSFYMPYISITNLEVKRSMDPFINNFISIKIFYSVDPIDVEAVLEAQVNDNTSEYVLT